MNFSVVPTDNFKQEVKQLAEKYRGSVGISGEKMKLYLRF
jgi:hypothetical protein